MSQVQRRLITYCSNIHRAESWQETFAALREHVPRVKERVSPEHAFPIGLRLCERAATELAAWGVDRFEEWLRAENCFVPTINGFAYGAFHGTLVKMNAYLPDWHSRERRDYTILLADLLSGWLPEGMTGSISTVPVGFKAHVSPVEFRARLLDVLRHLDQLWQVRGADIVLALEPEPGCVLETAADMAHFVEWMDFPEELQSRLGICLDCCHHAIQFEDPGEVAAALAGVRIAKVQASSALTVTHDRRQALNPFVEPRYLHQVVIRDRNGRLSRYYDLPDALLEHEGEGGDEWRCHFHVPLFMERAGEVETTRFFVEGLLPHLDPGLLLEVETYSWSALQPKLRPEGLTESIVREIRWLQEAADAAHRRP